MRRWGLCLFVGMVMLGGCQLTDPNLDRAGTVRFVDVEGGCWVIEEGNRRLEPINLDASHRIDGLDVRFQADARTDLASICQVGEIVELTRIVVAGS